MPQLQAAGCRDFQAPQCCLGGAEKLQQCKSAAAAAAAVPGQYIQQATVQAVGQDVAANGKESDRSALGSWTNLCQAAGTCRLVALRLHLTAWITCGAAGSSGHPRVAAS